MRLIALHIALLICNIASAQLMNNGSTIFINSDAQVAVRGTSVYNNGDVKHEGYLIVDKNISNTAQWICDSINENTIELGENWSNDSTFLPGIGVVNFIGDNQNISGTQTTPFFKLNLMGKPLSVKALYSNIEVHHKLNLFDAELACNQSEATMTINSLEISRNKGFVSTKFTGRLNRQFEHQKTLYSFFPLGYNDRGKIIMQPVVVTATDSGTFRTAFLYENPSQYGMSTFSLDDSLCTVNDEFFHIVGSDPEAQATFALVSDDEYSWTKLASWKGPWTKMQGSKFGSFGQEEGFGVTDHTLGQDKPVVFATEKPFVDIPEDLVYVPYNSSYEIKPDYYRPANSTLTWSPPDQLSCDDCPNPVYSAGLPETYVVEIDNNSGCSASDTIRFLVTRGENNPTLIPNAFSPNFDGLNDIFLPHLYSFEELVVMSIYNRWGEKIYEGADGWDGTYRGKPVPMGSYLYKIEIKELIKNGYHRSVHLSGILTIIR